MRNALDFNMRTWEVKNRSTDMSMRISEAAKKIGVSTSTLRAYCNNGRIKYRTNPGGQRIFEQNDIDDFLGKPHTPKEGKTAYYVRASDGNKNTLKNQETELANAYGPDYILYTDRTSGLNEKRPGLTRMINDLEKGKITHIKTTYPDRITRFGRTYIEHIITTAGGDIQYLHEQENLPIEQELLNDFMKLLASFSGKFYKMRSMSNQKKVLQLAEKELEKKEEEKQGR
jgi:putative resolvase